MNRMVKVIKKDKRVQVFKASKIVKACRGAGVPQPIAQAVSKIVAKKVRGKKKVTSAQIKKIIFDIFDGMAKAKKHWTLHKKKKK